MRTDWTCPPHIFPIFALLASFVACVDVPGQSAVLAKVAIGMPEEQVTTAIGPTYHLKRRTYSNLPSMTSLIAEIDPSHRTATGEYEFTFVEGKLEAFTFSRQYTPPDQPLASNVYRSVADKLGDATDGARAGNGYWVLDAQGHPVVDNRLKADCYNSGTQGLPPVATHDSRCGLWVRLASVPGYVNGTLASTSLTVVNEAAFNGLAAQLRQAAQQKKTQQQNQANQVKSPF